MSHDRRLPCRAAVARWLLVPLILGLAACALPRLQTGPARAPATLTIHNRTPEPIRVYLVEETAGASPWLLGRVGSLQIARLPLPEGVNRQVGRTIRLVAVPMGTSLSDSQGAIGLREGVHSIGEASESLSRLRWVFSGGQLFSVPGTTARI